MPPAPSRSAAKSSASAAPPAAAPGSAAQRWLGPVGFTLTLIASVLWFSSRGLGEEAEASSGIIAAVWAIIAGGGLAAMYLGGAIGWGRAAAAVLVPRASRSRVWLQAGLGLGLMLVASHGLGVLGAFGGAAGPYLAWAVTGGGLLLLADQVARAELRPERWGVLPGWSVLAAPAIGLMLVAASSPPGSLWASEAGGYDTLSYHLQLPKEWLELGRIVPLEHNVYSFLPGHMEAAFTHLGAMTLPMADSAAAAMGPRAAYIGGTGIGLLAAQMLHALVGVLAAAMIGRVAWALLTGGGMGEVTARFAGSLAAAAVLATPWTIVVGSMAYNELAVLALGATAALAAVDAGIGPVRRAVLAGLLVGMACGAKPTAAFTVGPVAGLLLLGMVRGEDAPTLARRAWVWAKMVLAGSVAGVLPMAPWMIRNAMAADGNPVFPFAAGLLGSAHWSAEQVARYSGAHHASEPWGERLALLFSATRGVAHPQWSIMVVAGAAGLLAAALWGRTRRAGALLAAGLPAIVVAWLALTHLQSRFLVPALLPLGVGVGVGAAALVAALARLGKTRRHGMALAGAWVCAGVPVGLTVAAVNVFRAEHGGAPNLMLPLGVEARTALPYLPFFKASTPWEKEAQLRRIATPEAFCNLLIEPDQTVYLLGDATPLYYSGRVLYHTTWDRSPLGELVAKYPGRPEAEEGRKWAEELHARGVRFIVVNVSELHRLIEVDNWYDRDVTLGMVEIWAKRWCDLVHEWPQRGQYLLKLREPSPQAAGEGPAR